jgi:hypothetical protein
MHTSQQQNLVENLFNSIKCKNQEFLREKRLKYGYDFELDRPLSNTKIKKVEEYSKEQNKTHSVNLNLVDINFNFELEENKSSFKDEARKILCNNLKRNKMKKMKEGCGLKESSDINSQV